MNVESELRKLRKCATIKTNGSPKTLKDLIFGADGARRIGAAPAEKAPSLELQQFLVIGTLPPAMAEIVLKLWKGESVPEKTVRRELDKLTPADRKECLEVMALVGL